MFYRFLMIMASLAAPAPAPAPATIVVATNPGISPEHQTIMDEGKSIPCQNSQCRGGQPRFPLLGSSWEQGARQHVKYSRVRGGGSLLCRDCIRALTCFVCHKEYKVQQMSKAIIYKGMCIACTECDRCGEPKWDWNCPCMLST